MHKTITLCFILAFGNMAYAQLFSYGPKIGVSFSSFSGSNADISSGGSGTGFSFGFFIMKDFPGAYLHIEPTYTTGLGGSVTDNYSGQVFPIDDISTFGLPIMFGKKISKVRFFFGVSPTGMMNSNKLAHLNPTYKIYFDYIVGVGVDLSNFFISARYSNAMVGGPVEINSGSEPFFLKVPQISLNVGLKLNKN